MSDTSLTTQLQNRKRRDLEKKIRKLERRLTEVEALSPDALNLAEADALRSAIRASLLETGMLSHYAEAENFYDGLNSASHVAITEKSKARSVAFLKRAIQSLNEDFEDEFLDAVRPEDLRERHSSRAGRAMSGITRVGSGIANPGPAPLGDFAVNATAEVENDPQRAFDLLTARVALLEAALASPKPRLELPIGPGHNGPPEFEPPFEENEIRELVDLLKAQGPTTPTDLPKLIAVSQATEVKISKLAEYADTFASAAVKSAGSEAGKRLVQAPWWLSVGSALLGVSQALIAWLGVLPH